MNRHLINVFSGDALTACGEMAAVPREIVSELEDMNCRACRAALIAGGRCPGCGLQRLEWGTHPRKKTSVADGRLTANDVETIFYLACGYCSDTVIPQVDPEVVAAALTEMGWTPQ